MSDAGLRRLERAYLAAPTQERLLRLLEARIRAGMEPEPHRVRALVTKPAVRCFLHTAETTSLRNGATLVLEIPATEINPRTFPELGGEYVYELPLMGIAARSYLGLHIGFVTFEESDTGARLSTKPEDLPPPCSSCSGSGRHRPPGLSDPGWGQPCSSCAGAGTRPLIRLMPTFELRFTWAFNAAPKVFPIPPLLLIDGADHGQEKISANGDVRA